LQQLSGISKIQKDATRKIMNGWKKENLSKMTIQPKLEPVDENVETPNYNSSVATVSPTKMMATHPTVGKENVTSQRKSNAKNVTPQKTSNVDPKILPQLPRGWQSVCLNSGGQMVYVYINKYTKAKQSTFPTKPAKGDPKKTPFYFSRLSVSHRELYSPESWPSLPTPITRTKEEALELIKGYHAQILSGQASFQDLVMKYSEVRHMHQEGIVGEHLETRNPTSESYNPAWDLKVGEVSQPFFDRLGVSIVRRNL
jgi:hypothetical protein